MGIASRMRAGGGRVGEPGADIGVPVWGQVLSGWGAVLEANQQKLPHLEVSIQIKYLKAGPLANINKKQNGTRFIRKMALLSVFPFETIIFFDYTPNFLKLHRHIEARLEYYLIFSLLLGEGKTVSIPAFIVKVLSNFLFLPPVLKLAPKIDVFRLIPPFTARIVTAILPGCQ